MTKANHTRIGLASSPPCEQFRSRFPKRTTLGGAVAACFDISGDNSSLIAFIAAATVVGFATNLSMHLLNLRMQYLGATGLAIGWSVAVQALGIVAVAPLTKYVIRYVGVRLTVVFGVLLCASALTGLGVITNTIAWGGMRFVFAAGLALLFTSTESLVISRAAAGNRGRLVGWYATSLATGTTMGPLLIRTIGIQGLAPMLWSALIFGIAAVPILVFMKRGEQLAPVVRRSTWATLQFAPIAFLSAFVFGILDNGGMAMLSVYSVLTGYDYASAVTLAVFATVGAVILQVPLGYCASKIEPRIVLLFCGVVSMMLLAMLPEIISHKPAALGVSFSLGGLLEGLYTVGLICITRCYRGMGIASANGCFVAICGLGELVGPLASGGSMQYFGTQGFVVGLTATLALYCLALTAGSGGAVEAHPIGLGAEAPSL